MENQTMPASTSSMPERKMMMPLEELFKKSFALYYPKAFSMMFLLLICWLACLVIAAVFGGSALLLAWGDTTIFALLACLVILIGVFLMIVVGVWFQLALVSAVKETNNQINIKKLLMDVRGNIGSFFWAMFLRGLMVLGGLILFVIPGIIFSVWFAFTQYTFVFEGKRGFDASGHSRQLVKSYAWPVFGRIVLFGVLSILVSMIPRVGRFIDLLFVAPFGIFYLYCIYEDLKRVKA
jgi:hypothetical protein